MDIVAIRRILEELVKSRQKLSTDVPTRRLRDFWNLTKFFRRSFEILARLKLRGTNAEGMSSVLVLHMTRVHCKKEEVIHQ